jgi:hypothetical protein
MSAVRPRALAAGAIALGLVGAALASGSYATGIPANKAAASGSETEVVGANQSAVVLSETVKINNPTDLIISASAECSILTQVTNSANGQTERAFGQISFHVNIDGIAVPVSNENTDKGEVVFCNRAQEQQWTDSSAPGVGNDDGGDKLRQYQNTRTANAFNWLALNVGTNYPGTSDNVHKVELIATWTTSATAGAVASAVVGNRTLVLEPVKAWNREAVTIS